MRGVAMGVDAGFKHPCPTPNACCISFDGPIFWKLYLHASPADYDAIYTHGRRLHRSAIPLVARMPSSVPTGPHIPMAMRRTYHLTPVQVGSAVGGTDRGGRVE